MRWEIRDGLALIDELQNTLENAVTSADDKIGEAKQLWAAHKHDAAYQLLVRLTENSTANTVQQLAILKTIREHISRAGTLVDDRDARITRLEQQVEQLLVDRRKEEIQRSKQAGKRERREQKLLLGQAAYTFSELVESFVFNNEGAPVARHPSLTEMAKMAGRPTRSENEHTIKPRMTAAQKRRWQQVEAIMATIQPPHHFLDADQVLRELRYQPAHGSDAERQSTSLQQLLSWAGSVDEVSVGAVKQYVSLLSRFSSRNSPLEPNIDPAQVFEKT